MDPELQRRACEAQLSALEPMRGSRALAAGALAGACFLCIGAAGHLLRRAGVLPREGMRQLLGRAALVAAVLRTMEGAQIGRGVARGWAPRAGAGARRRARRSSHGSAAPAAFAARRPCVLHGARVAGAFLLLAQYFRSERVRALVAAQEPSALRRDG